MSKRGKWQNYKSDISKETKGTFDKVVKVVKDKSDNIIELTKDIFYKNRMTSRPWEPQKS